MNEKRVAYAGFEEILENLYGMKDALEAEKEQARNKALEEVELAFAEKYGRIQKAIENASYVVEEKEEPQEEAVEEDAEQCNEEVVDEAEE